MSGWAAAAGSRAAARQAATSRTALTQPSARPGCRFAAARVHRAARSGLRSACLRLRSAPAGTRSTPFADAPGLPARLGASASPRFARANGALRRSLARYALASLHRSRQRARPAPAGVSFARFRLLRPSQACSGHAASSDLRSGRDRRRARDQGPAAHPLFSRDVAGAARPLRPSPEHSALGARVRVRRGAASFLRGGAANDAGSP